MSSIVAGGVADRSMSSDPAIRSSHGRANAAEPGQIDAPAQRRVQAVAAALARELDRRRGCCAAGPVPAFRPSPARARSTISFSARTSNAPAGPPRAGGDDSDSASSVSRPSAVAGRSGAMRATAVPETTPRAVSFPGSGGRKRFDRQLRERQRHVALEARRLGREAPVDRDRVDQPAARADRAFRLGRDADRAAAERRVRRS